MLLLKGYFLGTIASSLVLNIAVAIIAPGDGGTLVALTSGLFVPIFVVLGLIALVIFPLAAIASWPLRRLVFRKPIIGLLLAAGCGLLIGALATAAGFKVGPDDFWSGSLVGLTYGVVWFLIVRFGGGQQVATIA